MGSRRDLLEEDDDVAATVVELDGSTWTTDSVDDVGLATDKISLYVSDIPTEILPSELEVEGDVPHSRDRGHSGGNSSQ